MYHSVVYATLTQRNGMAPMATYISTYVPYPKPEWFSSKTNPGAQIQYNPDCTRLQRLPPITKPMQCPP